MDEQILYVLFDTFYFTKFALLTLFVKEKVSNLWVCNFQTAESPVRLW